MSNLISSPINDYSMKSIINILQLLMNFLIEIFYFSLDKAFYHNSNKCSSEKAFSVKKYSLL